MITSDREVVKAIQQALAERIGRERFELWFESSVRFQRVGATLRVAAPDQFTLERLSKNFRSDIQQICGELLGPSASVEFYVHREEPSPGVVSAGQAPSESRSSSSSSSSSLAPGAQADKVGHGGDGRAAASGRRYASLSSYIVGDGNRLAYTAAEMVAARPGNSSPLLVYGSTGVGKTHLLEGVWTAMRRSPRRLRTVFLSAEQFTSHFLEALQGSGLPSFRRKHRGVDVLLIDDVQFFAGKRATLVELQHTVDALLRQGRQLVFAADRPPAELTGLGAELITRLAGGLVCGIERPDATVRKGVVRQLAGARGMAVPQDVADYLAEHLVGDARLLSGALNRLDAASRAGGQPISLELARTALVDLVQSAQRPVRLPDIERAVCHVFGLESQALKSDKKSREVSHPRMLAMWLARKHTRAAFSEIGRYFGHRTHSTVISAERKVDQWMTDNAAVQLAHGSCNVTAAIRRIEGQLRVG